MRSWIVAIWVWAGFFSAVAGLAGEWTTNRGDAGATGFAPGTMPKDPQLLWEVAWDKSGFEGSPVVADGKLWAGDVEGKVVCLELATGKELWSQSFKNGFVASPAYRRGRLVFGDYDGHVYCLSAEDGKVLWEAEIQQAMAAGANFFEELVLITSEGGQLFAFGLEDGKLAWEYSTGDQLRSSPSIWNGHALLGGCDGRLHKIDLKQGTSIGDGLMLEGPSGSTPALFGNTAVVPTQTGQVLAFDMKSGDRLWSFADAERAQEIRSSPAVAPMDATQSDGAAVAVVTTRNRRVLALDTRDGRMVWEAVVRKRCDASAVICDGRVWVGGLDGTLYALDLRTGETTWSYPVTGQLIASPTLVDGKVIAVTDKGSILCFGAR